MADLCRIDDQPDQDAVLEAEYQQSQAPDGDELRDMMRQQLVDDLSLARIPQDTIDSLEDSIGSLKDILKELTKKKAS